MELLDMEPDLFGGQCEYEIIIDMDVLLEFESTSGKCLGVLYESEYNLLVVDLVRDTKGNTFAYERLIQKNSQSAVLTIPIYEGHFVFIRQNRHATRNQQLCLPRGFGTKGVSLEDNACIELREEIGARVASLQLLGYMTPDSGMLSTRVGMVVAQLESYEDGCDHEGISRVELYTELEVRQMLKAGDIEDGFTLAALGMYFNK